MADLFKAQKSKGSDGYSAKDIEVLEGLEPVRRRPGMYIGGTDEHAMHHLVSEVFDNAMDEAVAGHAKVIEIHLKKDNEITISDDGRGIPIDPHPKFPKKSALEVILTTLHSGGKFSQKAYQTAGGLHGVGISVVNALSDRLVVEVVRDKKLYSQSYSRGERKSKLESEGAAGRRKGTTVTFHPDAEIFGNAKFRPAKLYKLARSKAYLFRGVEIRWKCDPSLIKEGEGIPAEESIHFPGGLGDFLASVIEGRQTVTPEPFTGEAELGERGRVEWAVAWPLHGEGYKSFYCNTIPTPEGGTHETGLRGALAKGLRAYGELVNNKKVGILTADDILDDSVALLSLFIKDPQFQGQTKEKLVTADVARLVENGMRDHFDHWLSGNPASANALLAYCIQQAEDRMRRRQEKDISRKLPTQRLRLPGKLADCTRSNRKGTELFLVEGDSAGGSAKQARDRETQAILPLRGKILNVASATPDKIRANQEISDIITALGCGTGSHYREEDLRYEKLIIMTDADVDGAHIASLLMTFFYREMPGLIENGHLYLAQPPLYRLTQGTQHFYARDDAHKEQLLKELSNGRGNVELGRFKGLGEMTASQLKETTMDPSKRILLRVKVVEEERQATENQVESLMGKKPELRFQFIQEQMATRGEQIAENLDV